MKISDRISRHRFLLLLIALILLMSSYPIEEGGGQARIAFQSFFQLVLLAGLFAMRRARLWILLGVIAVVPAILASWAPLFLKRSFDLPWVLVEAGGGLATVLYLLLLIAFILRDLFSSTEVTNDRLCGALSAYILLGVLWGFLYTGVELLAPGSFFFMPGLDGVSMQEASGEIHHTGVLFYYSFVTLTTLGFGDITPVGHTAQMLTMWEAIAGQAYLTILVARLVGLHVSASSKSDSE